MDGAGYQNDTVARGTRIGPFNQSARDEDLVNLEVFSSHLGAFVQLLLI